MVDNNEKEHTERAQIKHTGFIHYQHFSSSARHLIFNIFILKIFLF